ncbi:alpha/beta hydrolase [Actinomadura craniellae]|uniref:Alpha/beta hydrolase n=1 Tax=Actinomadura craniellae TaxID=2231787 RepID=A0A365H890_9ACTN|nr:alpha/beta hydrolase [Actinomadura craniellae]RAY15325.1 alpha/beta hydrolase [Actinomadura craniellae]
MGTGRRILTATAVGAGAAGAAGAGLALQRNAVHRLRLRPDPYAGEPFGSLRGQPVQVRATDGTRLYAEIDDPDRTDLAIVFSHGWTLTQDSWHFQRRALRGLGRLVFWDQRGHGRSDPGDRLGNDVPLLGHDLAAVIEQTVPKGTPVILVGHSMGGMTIMKYADLYPAEIGRRVRAAALVCTSSGGLNQVTLGMPALLARLTQRLLPRTLRAAGAGAGLIERVRHLGRDGAVLVEDLIAFGPEASPTAVRFAEEMMAETRMEALLDFFRSMITNESISDCTALSAADVLIIGAEKDALTPLSHSARIADCLPSARFETIPGSGHMAMMERPGAVSTHLTDLVEHTRKELC